MAKTFEQREKEFNVEIIEKFDQNLKNYEKSLSILHAFMMTAFGSMGLYGVFDYKILAVSASLTYVLVMASSVVTEKYLDTCVYKANRECVDPEENLEKINEEVEDEKCKNIFMFVSFLIMGLCSSIIISPKTLKASLIPILLLTVAGYYGFDGIRDIITSEKVENERDLLKSADFVYQRTINRK